MNPNFFATILANALPQIIHGFLKVCIAVLANPLAFWMVFAFVAFGVIRLVMPLTRRRRRRA
jgi:Mg2+/citrate symporter